MGLSSQSVMPTIAVDDLDRAISFYSETLGLTVRRLEGDMDSALVDVGSSDRLLLYKSSYRRGETTYASFFGEDVEGTVRELRGKGVTFEEYDFPGLKTVTASPPSAISRPAGSGTARATSSPSPTRWPRSCARPP